MEERIKYKHKTLDFTAKWDKDQLCYYVYHNSHTGGCCSLIKELVEQGNDWVKVEEPVIYSLVKDGSLIDRPYHPHKYYFNAPLNAFQITAIKSLLNEEKESTWRDEEIEAIKKLHAEWRIIDYATSSFSDFLDSKKGQKKQ
jgi:hypothetical protein